MACSVDGRSYTLLAWHSMCLAFLDDACGCQWPRYWTSGILYRLLLSLAPISIGLSLQVMRTSVSLRTVTPSLVKIDIVSASDVLPTLNSECGKSLNASASVVCWLSLGMGNHVMLLP